MARVALTPPSTRTRFDRVLVSATSSGVTGVAGGPAGGTLSTDGEYIYHTFTDNGTFSLGALEELDVDVLVVGGGGGGAEGGGGGGGVEILTAETVTAAVSVLVGAGGTASGTIGTAGQGGDGGDSSFGATTAAGGGGGGGYDGSTNASTNGRPGGSGGGAGALAVSVAQGGAGTATFGNDGGDGNNSAPFPTGGGGGAGAAGGSAVGAIGGDGGDGIEWPTGSGEYYGGGGGGNDYQGSAGPTTGGLGGGGAGHGFGTAGVDGRGGGGGGGRNGGTSAAGGDGVVIVRYPIPVSGGTITVEPDGTIVHTFTTSGTLTIPSAAPGTLTPDVLIVGGGGGGAAGGGGAGGAEIAAPTITSDTTVTIGAGGVGQDTSVSPTNGGDSVFGATTAAGGGAGGPHPAASGTNGASGGSGGGGAGTGATGGSATATYGNAGGGGSATNAGAGGGGAGAAGSPAAAGGNGGSGGDGLEWPTGSGNYYGGGGGGGGTTTSGAGGNGGGGAGANNGPATSGTDGLGGGGGAIWTTYPAGDGGAGVVIVRYTLDQWVLNAHGRVAKWVAANSADVVAYVPMDDATNSGTIDDRGPNNLDGTYSAAGTITTRAVDGVAIADFGGSTGRSELPYDAALNTVVAAFMVVEVDSIASGQGMFAHRDDIANAARSYQFRRNAAHLELLTDITGTPDTTQAASVFSTGTRYTIGWWHDGTDARLYVNGSVAATATVAAPSATSAPLMFGWFSSVGSPSRHDGALGSVVQLSAADASTIPALHDAWVGT